MSTFLMFYSSISAVTCTFCCWYRSPFTFATLCYEECWHPERKTKRRVTFSLLSCLSWIMNRKKVVQHVLPFLKRCRARTRDGLETLSKNLNLQIVSELLNPMKVLNMQLLSLHLNMFCSAKNEWDGLRKKKTPARFVNYNLQVPNLGPWLDG